MVYSYYTLKWNLLPLFSYCCWLPEFYSPFAPARYSFSCWNGRGGSGERIFAILLLAPTAGRENGQELVAGDKIAIAFENVHYAYEGGKRPALAGITFEIKAGQQVALVGASGSWEEYASKFTVIIHGAQSRRHLY